MTDSLTLSLLLFFAIVVLAVLARELWRMVGLRRDRVRTAPRPQVDRGRGQPPSRVAPFRQEPGLDSLDLPAAVRIEPDFPIPDDVREQSDRGHAPAASLGGGSTPWRESEGAHGDSVDPRDSAGPETSRPTPVRSPSPSDAAEALPPTQMAGQPAASTSAPGHTDPVSLPPERSPLQASPEDRPAPSEDRPAHSAGRPASPHWPSDPPSLPASPVATQLTGSGSLPGQSMGSPAAITDAKSLSAVIQAADDSTLPAGPMLSITTDCIVDLACSGPVAGERLVSIAQGFRRCGTKPVLIEVPIPGATAASNRQWRAPLAGDSCRAMRIGILLDNRSGPLNAMEFSEFLARVDETAERIGARYVAPQMTDVLQAARRLDADCAHLDWNAGLNVDASEVLGPGQLAALAMPLVIVERGSNRYARLDEYGDPVFSVSLGDRPNRLTFLLDLPRVLYPQEAWAQMVECALIAAKRLPGRLVDDGGKPLTEHFLASSAAQVHQRALALEAVGLKAGTSIARRVFN